MTTPWKLPLKADPKEPSCIYDANGVLIAEVRGPNEWTLADDEALAALIVRSVNVAGLVQAQEAA